MTLKSALRRFAVAAAAACLMGGGASAQQGLCDAPSDSCSRLIDPTCIERFGAGATEVGPGDACAGPLQTYRECLSTVATLCGGGAGPAAAAALPQKIEGPEVGGATRVEIIQHKPAPLEGCIAAESLPTHGVYFISPKTMFCRPDGSIWLRVLEINPNYGVYVKWTNVYRAQQGQCKGVQPSCTIEDDVSGALRMQVLGMERVKGESVMKVMLSKD